MVDEIARLGVAVDSTPAVSATRDLDQLAAAGDRATTSTRNLSQSWEGARFSSEKLYAINRGVRDFRTQMQTARDAANQLDNSWKKQTFSPRQLYSLNQSLNRYRTELAQAKVASDQMATSNKVQADSHHQVAKAAAGYNKSAKELAFATRNLPAQFTDIAVSLQAGQNPMTVLLQQGGQLKDMFGGIGPAARAMGNYVAGLVTPFTVAAAAAVALATAFVQGESEMVRYERALASVGHTVGVTAQDLDRMARNMEGGAVTQRAASLALAEVAKNGRIAGQQIELVATAALNMERATGTALSETIDKFVELGRSPTEAVAKLNEEERFLTATVYEQIKALEEQGRTAEAARLAQTAYADALNERSKDMLDSLGTLERGFYYLKIGAKAAWDAVLDVGRPTAGDAEFNALHKQLQRSLEIATSYDDAGSDRPEWLTNRINKLKADMKVLSDENVRQTKAANDRMLRQEADQYAIRLDQEAVMYASASERRVRMVTKQNEEYRQAVLREERIGGADLAERLARLREDHEKVVAGINERYKDPKKPATAADRELRAQEREYDRLNKALDQHVATLRAAGEAQDRLTTFERWAVRTLADLSGEHSNLSPAQREEIRNRIENTRVLDRENAERERQEKAMRINVDLANRLAAAERQQRASMDGELRSMGMGSEQAALANAMEAIQRRAVEERIQLAERMGEINSENTEEYLEGLRQINEAEQRQLDNEVEHWHRRRAAMADWRNGARAAMDEIEMASWDVAGQTKDAYLTAFSAMNNALNTFAETGKLKIRDFATVVIAELTRIALTIALSNALTAMFGGVNTGANVNAGGTAYGAGVRAAARGAVMAGGHLYSMARGGVRNSPTLLPMANGGSVLMAEQAPEAIMPLARGPDGKLGVRAGGGGGTTITAITNVTINQDGTATSNVDVGGNEENARDGRRLAAALDEKIREVLIKEQRHGGILWNMKNRG